MKVLVTAASKHGATAEIAEAIAARLDAIGHDVVLAAPQSVTSLDGIDAAVIGSAVYAGHWMPEATALIAHNRDSWAARRVWLYSSGPIGEPAKPEGDPVEVGDLMEVTGAEDHALFSGRLDKQLLSFGERAMVMALRAPTGDFRDWDVINGWADQIGELLRYGEPMVGVEP